MTYRLDLPAKLEHVHNVFDILKLRKYVPDPIHVILTDPIKVAENLVYEEHPMQILDYRVK